MKMLKRWILAVVVIVLFGVLVSSNELWQAGLGFLFQSETVVLHPRAPLIAFVAEHLELVLLSSGLTILIGVPAGIWVTRESGRNLLSMVNNLTSLGQTFPPVAVLALTVPVLGFGLTPTVVALFLYGLLPVVHNTIAGLNAVPKDAVETAAGMGMNRWQILVKVEAPLALPVVLTGIRLSVIINIGTAMVGAVIGAGGLGSPIIAGLIQDNLAFVLEGAIPAAIMAVIADLLLLNFEQTFAYPK